MFNSNREQNDNIIRFTCENSDNIINYELINNICVMIDIYIDYNNIKLFFALLKFSINSLKDNNITQLQQYINKSDYDLLDKNKWQIVKDDNNILLIQCEINDAVENIAYGLGFSKD